MAHASSASHIKTARQVNLFFDTPEIDLDQNKFTVRIRKEDRKFELGAKSPGGQGISSQIDEQEVLVEGGLAEEILEGKTNPLDALLAKKPESAELVKSIRKLIGNKRLEKIGGFVNFRETLRAVLEGVGTQQLEMDTTIFQNGLVNYEIEVEVPRGQEGRKKTI